MPTTRAPSPHRTLAVLAWLALVGAASATTPRPAARATVERPVIDIALDEGTLTLTADWARQALVQIVSASGQVRGAVLDGRSQPSRPQEKRFDLRTGADTFTTLLVVPGDVVETQFRDEVFRTAVPLFDVRIDPEADVISGTFPPAPSVSVSVWDARDPNRDAFDAERLAQRLPAPNGRVRLDLAGRYDVRPGTGVTLSFTDAAGNRFVANRAVPSVDIRNAAIAVRADPGSEPRLVVASGDDVIWDSGPMYWSGGLDYSGTLSRSNDEIGQPYVRHPGDRLSLVLGGRTIAAAVTVPAMAGRHDPEIGAVSGIGPSGAVLELEHKLGPAQGLQRTVLRTTVGPDGRFAFDPLPPGGSLSGGLRIVDPVPIRFSFVAPVTGEQVTLYGNRVVHTDDGVGTTRVTHSPAGGGAAVRRTAEGPQGSTNQTDMFVGPGRAAVFAPGDRIEFAPDGGTVVALTVPGAGLTIDPATNTATGFGPPSSDVRIELDETDIGRLAPVAVTKDRPPWLRARTDDAGRLAFKCWPHLRCQSGVVDFTVAWHGPATGRPTFRLFVQDAPLTGIAPDISALLGYATAGTIVSASLLDNAGHPVATRSATAVVDDRNRPAWVIDWRDLFPNGIPAGVRFRVDVGGRPIELRLPPIALEYDVLTDEVWGTAPPDHTLDVWALPGPPATAAPKLQRTLSPPVDGEGRWRVSYHDRLNLRAGDGVLVNVLAPDGGTFYQRVRSPLDGPLNEPTETPTPLPARTATTRPPATATAMRTVWPTLVPRPTGSATPTREASEPGVWLPFVAAGDG